MGHPLLVFGANTFRSIL